MISRGHHVKQSHINHLLISSLRLSVIHFQPMFNRKVVPREVPNPTRSPSGQFEIPLSLPCNRAAPNTDRQNTRSIQAARSKCGDFYLAIRWEMELLWPAHLLFCLHACSHKRAHDCERKWQTIGIEAIGEVHLAVHDHALAARQISFNFPSSHPSPYPSIKSFLSAAAFCPSSHSISVIGSSTATCWPKTASH